MNKRNLFLTEDDATNLKINHSNRKDWVEESFALDVDNHIDTYSKIFNREDFLGMLVSTKKLFILGLLSTFLLSFLFIRSFYLQILKGEEYRRLAESNRIRSKPISAMRGVIYDRNKKLLVRNIPSFSLFITPADLPKDKDIRYKVYENIYNVLLKFNIIEPLNQFIENIENQINNGLMSYSYFPIIIKENLDYNEAILLYIATNQEPGFFVDVESKREYLLKDNDETNVLSLSHLLGYQGRLTEENLENIDQDKYILTDYIGKTGLEYYYEDMLRGNKGTETIEINALGKPVKVISLEKPQIGDALVLTIDFELQKKVEEILKNHLKKLNTNRAVVVVMNPNTGEILSLVSLPSYDVNSFARGILPGEYNELLADENKPLFNRAISGEYPSGSTFKLVVGAEALEENIITYNTVINSLGGIRIKQWFFPDWKAGGHGLASIKRAVAESINTFFYYIGGGYEQFEGLGVANINIAGKKFGLAKKTGIDLPAERTGFLPTPEWKKEKTGENWYIGDTYHLAIGQGGILVTPLQVANYTSVFANKGTLYSPYLLKKSINSVTKKEEEIPVKVLNKNFISQENLEILRGGMLSAVDYGSARSLRGLNLSIAGKTGTAQWHSAKDPHAWFTGFAPFNNPEIVVTVLVEEAGEGSAVATPIAGEIFKYYFSQK